MPRILPHVDALARSWQRDVFYIDFPPLEYDDEPMDADDEPMDADDDHALETDLTDEDSADRAASAESGTGLPSGMSFAGVRQGVIDWLDAQGVRYADCLGPASDEGFRRWRGEVVLLDATSAPEDAMTALVNAHLHAPDNSGLIRGVTLFCMRLARAQEKAYMDDPAYEWD